MNYILFVKLYLFGIIIKFTHLFIMGKSRYRELLESRNNLTNTQKIRVFIVYIGHLFLWAIIWPLFVICDTYDNIVSLLKGKSNDQT